MSAPEALRIALEAAIAALLAVLALRLAVSSRGRPGSFCLAALCGALSVTVVLNAVASAGIGPAARAANFYLDLLAPILLLGFVRLSGEQGAPLRPAYLGHLAVPPVGALLISADVPMAPDAWMVAVHATYLAVSIRAIRRRAETLRSLGLLGVAQCLVAGFALVLVLRVPLIFDAQVLASYRESGAYLAILCVVLAMAGAVTWSMLRDDAFGTDRAPAPAPDGVTAAAIADLERRLLELLDGERLFLEPGLTLAEVASRLDAPPRHVSHVISARLNENFRGIVNRLRVQHAARALAEGRSSITTVMFDSGFGSKSAFQREFRRCHGMSPTEYRARLDAARAPGTIRGSASA